MARIASTPAEVVAGEAVSGSLEQRWNDMLAIASVMANRAAATGTTLQDVVSAIQNNTKQFSAYNSPLPPGTASLVDMAQAAIDQVQQFGPINSSTFYATPSAVPNLPDHLAPEMSTAGHQFFTDPLNRSIVTAQGTMKVDPSRLGVQAKTATTVSIPGAVDPEAQQIGYVPARSSVTPHAVSLTSVAPVAKDAAFSASGLLSGAYPSFTPADQTGKMGVLATGDYSMPNVSKTLNSFGPVATAGVPGGQYASVNDRMGIADPGFNADRFAGPQVTGFNPDRFGAPDVMSQVMATPTPTLDAPQPHPSLNSFAGLTDTVRANATAGNPTNAGFDASASVPLTAGIFSPAVDQQVAAVNPPTTTSMGVLSTGDNLLGTQPGQMGILATRDNNLSFAAPSVTAGLPSGVSNVATGNFDQDRFARPATMDTVLSTPSYLGVPAAPPSDWSVMAAAQPVQSPTQQVADTAPRFDPLTSYAPSYSTVTPAETAINTTAQPSVVPDQFSGVLNSPGLLSQQSLTDVGQLTTAKPGAGILSSAITPDYHQYQSITPPDVQSLSTVNTDTQVSNIAGLPANLAQVTASYNPLNSYQSSYAPPSLDSSYQSVTQPQYQSIVNASFPNSVNVPGLQTIDVPDQPKVAPATDTSQVAVSVSGPATTPVTQQQQTPVTTTAAKTVPHSLFNGGTLTGGILGGLALGPAGGILGSLIGNQVNKAGGLTGLLGGQAPAMHEIPGGIANIGAIYGGGMPVGTTAPTNNGGFVTAMPGGMAAYTSPYGVTTTMDQTGKQYGYFGPSLTGDHSVNNGQPGGGGGTGYGSGLF